MDELDEIEKYVQSLEDSMIQMVSRLNEKKTEIQNIKYIVMRKCSCGNRNDINRHGSSKQGTCVDESHFAATKEQCCVCKKRLQSLCTGHPPDDGHNRVFKSSDIDTSHTTDPDKPNCMIGNAHDSSIQNILASSTKSRSFSQEKCLHDGHSEGISFPSSDTEIGSAICANDWKDIETHERIENGSFNENELDEFSPVEDEINSEDLKTLESASFIENASDEFLPVEDEEIQISGMEAETVENTEHAQTYNIVPSPKSEGILDVTCSKHPTPATDDPHQDQNDKSSKESKRCRSCELENELNDSSRDGEDMEEKLCPEQGPVHESVESCKSGFCERDVSSHTEYFDELESRKDAAINQPHTTTTTDTNTEALRLMYQTPQLGFNQNSNITCASMMGKRYSSHEEAILESPHQFQTYGKSAAREGNLHGLLPSKYYQILLLMRPDHGRASYGDSLSRTQLDEHMKIAITSMNGQVTFCILLLKAELQDSNQFRCRTPNNRRRIPMDNDMMVPEGQRQDNIKDSPSIDPQFLFNEGFRKDDNLSYRCNDMRENKIVLNSEDRGVSSECLTTMLERIRAPEVKEYHDASKNYKGAMDSIKKPLPRTEKSNHLEEESHPKLHNWPRVKMKDHAKQHTRKPHTYAIVREIGRPALVVHGTGTTGKPNDHMLLHDQPNLDESDGHFGYYRKMGTLTQCKNAKSSPTARFKKDSLPKSEPRKLTSKSFTPCHKQLDNGNTKDGSMNSSRTMSALSRGVCGAQLDFESSSCRSNSETELNDYTNSNESKANIVDRRTKSSDDGDGVQSPVLGQYNDGSNMKILLKDGNFEKDIEISCDLDDPEAPTSTNEKYVDKKRTDNVAVQFEDSFDQCQIEADGGDGTCSRMDTLSLCLCYTLLHKKTGAIASIILMLINQMGMWVKVYSDKKASDNQQLYIRSKNQGKSIQIEFKKSEPCSTSSLNLQVGRGNVFHIRRSMMETLRERCLFKPWLKPPEPLCGQGSYFRTTMPDRFITIARHPQTFWKNDDYLMFRIEFSMDLIHAFYEAAKAKEIEIMNLHKFNSCTDCTLLGNHSMPEGQCTILKPETFSGRLIQASSHSEYDVANDFDGSHHNDFHSVDGRDENTYVDVVTNFEVDRIISDFYCIGDRFNDNDGHVPSTISNGCSPLNAVRKTTTDNDNSDRIEALCSGIHHGLLDSANEAIIQELNASEPFSDFLHFLDAQVCSISDSGVYILKSDNLSEVTKKLDDINIFVQEFLFEILKGIELAAGVCLHEAKYISPSFELGSRD